MNHLVFLDSRAGALEKILSGIKSMVVKEYDPSQSPAQQVNPGDDLYFLRDDEDCSLRVTATVVHVLLLPVDPEQDISSTLKELQPRLQLTEEQYNYWSAKKQAQIVEFQSAHKIAEIHIASKTIRDRSGWVTFEQFGLIQ